jgi:hypothetical protein
VCHVCQYHTENPVNNSFAVALDLVSSVSRCLGGPATYISGPCGTGLMAEGKLG